MPFVGVHTGTDFGKVTSPFRLLPGHNHPLPSTEDAVAQLPFDGTLSRTFAALGGAAACKRLHALHPSRPGDEGAATGFALVLLGGMAAAGHAHPVPVRSPILWVQDRSARAESGRPYGLGLPAFGIDPAQLIFVAAKGALEVLAAAEVGLEIGGLAGVLAELPPHLPADMLALGKRLALRAERSATPCLLLHASARLVPAPVATRWQIASLPAVSDGAWGAPIPAADLTLVKNRFGPTGRWSVPLVQPSSVQHRLAQGVPDVCSASLPPPLSQPVDANAADRSRSTPAQGPVRGPVRGRAA